MAQAQLSLGEVGEVRVERAKLYLHYSQTLTPTLSFQRKKELSSTQRMDLPLDSLEQTDTVISCQTNESTILAFAKSALKTFKSVCVYVCMCTVCLCVFVCSVGHVRAYSGLLLWEKRTLTR